MTEQPVLVPAPVVADRAAGVVLGSAAGDALGAHYEFGPALPADALVGIIGGGAFGWAPGERTDDTTVAAENRTPTLAATWLCRHHGMDPTQALELAAAQLNEPKALLRSAVATVEKAS